MGDASDDLEEIRTKVARNTLRHVIMGIWEGTGEVVLNGFRGLDQGHHNLSKVILAFVGITLIVLFASYTFYSLMAEKFPTAHGHIKRVIYFAIIVTTLIALYIVFV